MNNAKLNWVRLPLEGVENCRELGGYSTNNGAQMKWHSFLRSSDLHELTEKDISFLEDYGVKTVIDLRGENEVTDRLNPLAERSFCNYHNIPLAGQLIQELNSTKNMPMGESYISLLKNSEQVKTIFNTIATAEDGVILFHCVAGKDRTGILAMLLLGLAGVERKDIISNYEVTYTNMESFKRSKKDRVLPAHVPESYLYSSREYIEAAYDYIIATHGTFENYLLAKDIDQEMIDCVKERCLDIRVGVEHA